MGICLWLLHCGLFVTGRLYFLGGGASVNTNWNRITWTASAEFVWIPCKETQKMTVNTKKFLLSFLSV